VRSPWTYRMSAVVLNDCLNMLYPSTYYTLPTPAVQHCLTRSTGAVPLLPSCHVCCFPNVLHWQCTPFRYAPTPILHCVRAVSVLLKKWWQRANNFPETSTWVHMVWFIFVLLVGGGFFINYQINHGLPPTPFFHPDSLECWYSRRETVVSVRA